MRYYQCRLKALEGDDETIAWIEERGAQVGFAVTLPELGNRWFRVLEAYPVSYSVGALRRKQASDRNAFPSIAGT